MIGIAIGMALYALQLIARNKDVIKAAKQLVRNVEESELTGTEKKEYVMSELKTFFRNIAPIILSSIIEIAVLDMQNENGVLKKKIEEAKNGQA